MGVHVYDWPTLIGSSQPL